VEALRGHADLRQRGLRALLERRRGEGRVARATAFWGFNGLAVTATPDVIAELASRPEVAAITPDEIAVVPTAAPAGPPEPNLAAIRAPDLWSLGFTGEGAVVATMDSGVDASHPDLAPRWRGGAGGWYDPYGQHATPYDRTGHGTWTLGVMVAGDAGGTTVGAAPGATWIAARVWNDAGSATASAIHAAFQWILDPDGDPATPDAPDVVNGSWAFGSPGCNLEFQADVQALVGAGIVPVFAAGNYGPGAGTSVSPANYPESLSVGSASNTGAVSADSSRGPSACGGGVYPTVVAPGVYVNTTDLFGFYYAVSGTSIAAPHVSGTMALLKGAFPDATPADLVSAVSRSARDLGAAGPDADSGHGFLDALAAHDLLAAGPPPPPPPQPPLAADDSFSVAEGTSATFSAPGVLANDSDPAGLPLTAALVSGASHGALSLQPDGGFSYTPAAGYSGGDAFTYRAGNGSLASDPATVTISVTPAARPPAAADDAWSVAEDGTLSVAAPGVLANDSDPAGKPLAAVLASGPANGTLTLLPDGSFSYVPRADFSGTDGFTYRPSNGALLGNLATATIAVTAVNDPPVAVDDAASTGRGTSVTIAVLANDRDVDGSLAAGTVSIVSSPAHGSVSRKSNGTVVYTPSRRYTGADSFRYRVKDNLGASSNAATVRIQVN
jgi:subtilisin family serine protease